MDEDDILQEKIKAYRAMLKDAKPDLDMELLLRILDMVNEECEVKVAIDPVDGEGGWLPSAPTYAVKSVKPLDDGRLCLRVSDEKHGISAGALHTQLKKALKRTSGSKVPVIFTHKGAVVTLTDVYSHALVRQVYAGLPFDLVLATAMDKPAPAKDAD